MIRHFLHPYRSSVRLATAAVLAQAVGGLVTPYLVKVGINQGVLARNPHVLGTVALAYLGVAAFQAAAGHVEVRAVARAGQHTLHDLRRALFGRLQALSLDFFEQDRPGRVVARMTNDVEAAGFLLSDGLVGLITSAVTVLAIAVIMALLDWRLALVTLSVAPPLALALWWFRRRARNAWQAVREASTAVTVQLQEALTGVRTLQAFRRERTALAGITTAGNAQRRAELRAVRLSALFLPSVAATGSAATAIILAVGGEQVLRGQLAIGTLAAFLLYLGGFFGPVNQWLELYGSAQAATVGADRIAESFALAPTVAAPETPGRLSALHGTLDVSCVSFSYPGGPEVLHDIRLRVTAGETVGLVGATGAGKSTLAKLLARFYDPSRGRVTLDGLDLRSLADRDLRSAIGYVPQEGYLFAGTVRENIAFGRPVASDAELTAAVASVGAGSLIEALPAGLDTEVGERGVRLSAGERQLISLARAWIVHPAVLILDEATSALEEAAEARVADAIRRLRAGRTTVIIAHRPSALIHADRVVVIENGRVGSS